MKYCPYILLTIWLFSDIYLLEASYPHQSTPSTDLSKNQFNEINTKVGELEEVFGHFIETVKSVKESKPENVDELKKKINGHKNKFLELMNIMMSYLDQPTPSTDLSENQINAIIERAVELKKGFEHLKNSYTSVFEKSKIENVDELMNGLNENKRKVQNLMNIIMNVIKTIVPNSNPGDYNNVGSNTNSQYNGRQNFVGDSRPTVSRSTSTLNPYNPPSNGVPNNVGDSRPTESRSISNLNPYNSPSNGVPNKLGNTITKYGNRTIVRVKVKRDNDDGQPNNQLQPTTNAANDGDDAKIEEIYNTTILKSKLMSDSNKLFMIYFTTDSNETNESLMKLATTYKSFLVVLKVNKKNFINIEDYYKCKPETFPSFNFYKAGLKQVHTVIGENYTKLKEIIESYKK